MSPAKKLRVLDQDEFDQLLSWLDPDPEQAGLAYEKIRRRLIAILASRGCACAEVLADETIDRVARRTNEIRHTYVGEKALYFLGVMNNVHHEYLKQPVLPRLPARDSDAEAKEKIHACLDRCLDKLTTTSRVIIERYYAEDRRAKINLRRRLAEDFGLRPITLRSRALRIREKLQACILQCLQSETL